jgi:hypothetical protein
MLKLKILIFITSLFAVALVACREGMVTANLDLLSFFEPAERNFSSPYTVPAVVPIGQQIPGVPAVVFVLGDDVEVNLLEGGSDIVDTEGSSLTFRIRVEPQSFSGSGRIALTLSDEPSFSSQGDGLLLRLESQTRQLPAKFEIVSSDPHLNEILASREVFILYESEVTADQVAGNQISVSGEVEEFKAIVSGRQGLL